jgi:hypothetical protein
MGAPEALDVAESTPHVPPLQPGPDSVQLTPCFLLSLLTVAVKLCACPAGRDKLAGETLTAIDALSGGSELFGVLEETLELTGTEAHPAKSKTIEAADSRTKISLRLVPRTHRAIFKRRLLHAIRAENTPLAFTIVLRRPGATNKGV